MYVCMYVCIYVCRLKLTKYIYIYIFIYLYISISEAYSINRIFSLHVRSVLSIFDCPSELCYFKVLSRGGSNVNITYICLCVCVCTILCVYVYTRMYASVVCVYMTLVVLNRSFARNRKLRRKPRKN